MPPVVSALSPAASIDARTILQLEPKPLLEGRRHWSATLGGALSLLIFSAVAWQLRTINLPDLAAMADYGARIAAMLKAGDVVALEGGLGAGKTTLARAILAFVAHEDVPVVGTLVGPKLGAVGAIRHCHHAMKMTMLREAGFTGDVATAYTDSSADLPLLRAARVPVVVNPKASRVAMFRAELPPGTPILNWGCPGRAGEPVAAR